MPIPCNFVPSKEGGHWHLTKQDAEVCKETWKEWSNVWNTTKGDISPQREKSLNTRNF